MQEIDLSHWDTVHQLSAEQVISLATGVDPYSIASLPPTLTAKQRLLRQHLKEGYFRAAAWAFDMAKHISADADAVEDAYDCVGRLHIPANGHSPLKGKFRSLSYHAEKTGLIPSLALAAAFEMAAIARFDSDSLEWIHRQGESLPADAIFVRLAIHDWLEILGWRSEYNFAPWSANPVSKNMEQTVSDRPNIRWPWGDYETPLLRLLPLVYEEHWKKYDPKRPATAPKSQVVEDWLVSTHKAPRRVAEVIAQLFRAEAIPNGPRRDAK